MGLEARISVVTLGVADVARARDFYQALGWPSSGPPEDGVAFFANAGSRLALYPRAALAEEAGRAAAPPGPIGVTLAVNLESREEVDRALAAVVESGGTLLRPAQERFWAATPAISPIRTATPGRSPSTRSGRSARTGCRSCPDQIPSSASVTPRTARARSAR